MRQEWRGAPPSDGADSTRGILEPGAARRGFHLVRLTPTPDLADLVAWHWAIRWDLPPDTHHVQAVIGHPNANLVAETGGLMVHGIVPGVFVRTLRGRGAVLGTKLRPGALRLLWDVPEAVRPGIVVPAATVLGVTGAKEARRAIEDVEDGDVERASETIAPMLRAAAVDRRTPRAVRALTAIDEVLALVVASRPGPGTTVEDLARTVGVTSRTLQRHFSRWVGVGPQWVLLRHRVHLAADLIAIDPTRDLAALAVETGYFDQAHLGTDFLRVTGWTPAAYARQCRAPVRVGRDGAR